MATTEELQARLETILNNRAITNPEVPVTLVQWANQWGFATDERVTGTLLIVDAGADPNNRVEMQREIATQGQKHWFLVNSTALYKTYCTKPQMNPEGGKLEVKAFFRNAQGDFTGGEGSSVAHGVTPASLATGCQADAAFLSVDDFGAFPDEIWFLVWALNDQSVTTEPFTFGLRQGC